MNADDEIFPGKNLSGLFKDIYNKSQEKDRQIKLLIGELRPLIKNVGDATVIVPIIKDYLDVSMKNDDHIIKMTGIIQRLISSEQRAKAVGGDDFGLSEQDKQQLLADLDNLEADIVNDDDDVQDDIDNTKNKINPPNTNGEEDKE